MTPLEKMQDNHRQLWGWLAKNPSKRKNDWPGWSSNGGKHSDYISSCFACMWIEKHSVSGSCGADNEVSKCPLDWKILGGCMNDKSYYQKWDNAKTNPTRVKYARLISKLKLARDK